MNLEKKERARVAVQVHLDKKRTQLERNRLGQFATPVELANAIAHFGTALLADSQQISFLDPAIGTGAFFSALVSKKGLLMLKDLRLIIIMECRLNGCGKNPF